jgi:putative transposase
MDAAGGAPVHWQPPPESPKPPFTAGCRPSQNSRTCTSITAPRKPDGYKLSTDPFFVENVRDIVGLYLNPPDKAMVLCVDEKTQIQALDRTQPLLPRGLGYDVGVTHDSIRHATTTLFAALDVATGEVLTQCRPRHRSQEFLAFLRQIETSVPEDLDVHLVVDNTCTHKHALDRRSSSQR